MERSELKERNSRYREAVSKLFIDTAKIILAGIVIGGLSPVFTGSYDNINYVIIAIGLAIFFMSAWLGCRILKT